MTDTDNIDDTEMLHAYFEAEHLLNPDDRPWLRWKLGLSVNDLDRRIRGLQVEYEFALLAYYSGVCKHIQPLDESLKFLTDSKPSDYLLKLNSGETVMVEVKSKTCPDFSRIKICGKNYIEKKMAFAEDFGSDLYFAIKFNQTWALFEAQFLLDDNGHIKYVSDFNHSKLDQIFNLSHIHIPPMFRLSCVYSSDPNIDIPPTRSNPKYGILTHCSFFLRDKMLVRCKGDDPFFYLATAIERYFNLLRTNKTSDTVTETVWGLPSKILIPEYLLFLSAIYNSTNDFGELDSPRGMLSFLRDKLREFPPDHMRTMVTEMIGKLNGLDSDIFFKSDVNYSDTDLFCE